MEDLNASSFGGPQWLRRLSTRLPPWELTPVLRNKPHPPRRHFLRNGASEQTESRLTSSAYRPLGNLTKSTGPASKLHKHRDCLPGYTRGLLSRNPPESPFTNKNAFGSTELLNRGRSQKGRERFKVTYCSRVCTPESSDIPAVLPAAPALPTPTRQVAGRDRPALLRPPYPGPVARVQLDGPVGQLHGALQWLRQSRPRPQRPWRRRGGGGGQARGLARSPNARAGPGCRARAYIRRKRRNASKARFFRQLPPVMLRPLLLGPWGSRGVTLSAQQSSHTAKSVC